MNYNINDIMPYIENYEFGEYFSTREEDFLISSISCAECPNFDWDDGASKLVLIPEDKDYVIKIPFNSSHDEFDDSYYDMSRNYCEEEIDLYNKISMEGLGGIFSQFFLPLTRVEEFQEYDIYIQPKGQVYRQVPHEKRSHFYSQGSMSKVKSSNLNHYTTLPDDWIAAVVEVLKDVHTVKKFFDILSKYDIDQDLHCGNIGYYNGKPVIIDYGSFYD